MIKKLKIKFIVIAMISVFAVISLMLGVINAMTYNYLNRSTDEILDLLSEGLGKFPEIIIPPEEDIEDDTTEEEDKPEGDPSKEDSSNEEEKEDKPPEYIIISPETPFDSRYFTVIMTPLGEWVESDMKQIAAVSEEAAREYAEEVFGTKKGQIDVYKYVSITAPESKNLMYIFLDCRRETSYQSFFMLMSFLIGALGILIAFFIVLLASGRVIKPMVEGHEKQKRFITNASHEIKTPITIIDANAELIEMESGESEWTEGIKKQTKRLVSLTEKLVTLTRMEESSAKTRSINFSISDAVRETAEPYTALSATRDKKFSFEIDDGINYSGDEAEIRQLVSILLDNAMKYSDEGGSISLSLKDSAKEVKLTVENSTAGVKRGKLNILFERFYRSDKARASDSHGFGIGLSVAEAIVNSHKGKINADSPDGINIVFTVTLFK